MVSLRKTHCFSHHSAAYNLAEQTFHKRSSCGCWWLADFICSLLQPLRVNHVITAVCLCASEQTRWVTHSVRVSLSVRVLWYQKSRNTGEPMLMLHLSHVGQKRLSWLRRKTPDYFSSLLTDFFFSISVHPNIGLFSSLIPISLQEGKVLFQ